MSLEFLDYNGNQINQYEDYWTSEPDQNQQKANFVLGAKTIVLKLVKQPDSTETAYIHIFEFMWLMTSTYA